MTVTIERRHIVWMQCDQPCCEQQYLITGIEVPADGLEEARRRGWWISTDPTVYADPKSNSNKPTLAYCREHADLAPKLA